MIASLVKVSPLDTTTGLRVPVRAASHNDRRFTGHTGVVWEPSLTAGPQIGISLWNGDFTDPITPGATQVSLNLEVLKKSYPGAAAYDWAGAPVEIYAADVGVTWNWVLTFVGRVKSYDGLYPALTLSAEVDTEPFNVNILTAAYAGSGGAEGGSDLANRLKPMVIGRAKNVEPVLIDAVNSVYQFSAYGGLDDITALYERGSAFPDADADHASYAALVAASIATGHWATCLAQGMVRLGAPAYGLITGDCNAVPRYTGEVISALASLAGISSSLLETGTLASLDALVDYPINIVITEQTKFLDLATRMVLACNWQAGVSLTGKFFAELVDIDELQVITFDAQGRQTPQVVSSQEVAVSPPYARTTLGAARCWRVHTPDEIAFTDKIVPVGLYDPARTYRAGELVDMEDGSRWLYVNAVPTAGNDPPAWPTASDAYWENSVPPLASAVSGYLTNESHVVAADSDGVVADFSTAGGSFKVLQASVDVTALCTFSVVSEAGVDVSIVPGTGVYSVASMSADQGTAVFRATFGSLTIDKVYSIAKSIGGAGAKLFRVNPNTQQVKYDTNGTIVAGQTVTLTALRQNTSANLVVKLFRLNSNGTATQIDAGAFLTGSGTVTDNVPDANSFTQTGLTVTLTGTNFNSAISTNLGVRIDVTCDGMTESVSVMKVKDGAAGLSFFLTSAAVTLPAAADGTVSDFSAANGLVKVVDAAGNDFTSLATIGAATASGCTGTVNTSTNTPVNGQPKGYYRVTAMSATSATLTIPVTLNGVGSNLVFALSKSPAGQSAKSFQITASSQQVKYSSAGLILSGQSIVVTGKKQNTAADMIVRLFRINANNSTTQIDAGIYMTGTGSVTQDVPDSNSFTQTGLTTTLTGTNFDTIVAGGSLGVQIQVTCDSITDTVSVWKTQDGAAAYTGYLTNESHTVPANSSGAVTSYAGATGDFVILQGGIDVSAAFTLSTLTNVQALSVSYASRTYSVSGGLDAGEVNAVLTIRATGSGAHAGVIVDKIFSLGKTIAGATGSPGSPGTNGANGIDALDVVVTKPTIMLPVNASNAVVSYAGATGSIVIRTPTGTDVSSNFALATVSNPQALTVGYVGQTFSVTSGFDANEDVAVLIIEATGSGAYTGFIYRRTVTFGKTFGNTNVSNDRNGASILTPTVATNGTALENDFNSDSTANITFVWGWAGVETDIDGFEIVVRCSTSAAAYTVGSIPAEETVFQLPPDRRAMTLPGQPSDRYYTFAVRAYRVVDTDINAAGIIRSTTVKATGTGENPYQPTATPNYIGSIAGQSAATLANAALNFNASNDRNPAAIVSPTIATDGTAVDHVVNTDSTADISFEWSWGGSEGDIDGFLVYMYRSTSSSAYTFGTTPAEEAVFTVPATSRAFVLAGVAVDKYYTFGVRAYRHVDPAISATGVIASTLVKTTGAGENPYRPSATAAFGGNVIGTINGTGASTVSTAVTTTNNGLNSDGTVKTTRVTTGSLVDHSVTVTTFAQSFSTYNFTSTANHTLQTVTFTVSGLTGGATVDVLLTFGVDLNLYTRNSASIVGAPAGYSRIQFDVTLTLTGGGIYGGQIIREQPLQGDTVRRYATGTAIATLNNGTFTFNLIGLPESGYDWPASGTLADAANPYLSATVLYK